MKEFWGKVLKTQECWLWLGSRFSDGYGRCWYDGKSMRAHRVAWFITHGSWPVVVMHKCDVRDCVRPSHLLGATQSDNMQDRERKGRGVHSYGEANGRAKLTDKEVAEIRERYSVGGVSYTDLTRMYGVSRSHVSRIVNNERRVTP